MVPIGTSLPELASSVIANLRGERDIAVGNVVSSNVFNLPGVLGMSVLLAPTSFSSSNDILEVDISIMTGVALIFLYLLYLEFDAAQLFTLCLSKNS